MDKSNRRIFIKKGIVSGILGLFAGSAYSSELTPPEIKGPFYPVVAQKDKDFDLTRIAGSESVAKGRIILIQGQILDQNNNPVEDVTIDLWQANAAGRYRHPHDRNKAALDPAFQGWAILSSGKNGKFNFITVYPGSYPASKTWTRPPHIHFKVSKKGYVEIITQMYFPGHKLNDIDRLLNRKTKQQQKLMIAKKVQNEPEQYEYNIVLQKV